MSQRLSEHATVTVIETADIGGTNVTSGWLSMKNYARAMGIAVIGASWDSSDDVDEFRFQQATDSSGTSAKDLTTDASGGNYDTDSPIDSADDFALVEIRGEDLDTDNGFDYIRLYVAEGGDSGTDNITISVIRYGYAYPKKELQGAASTGSQVYVDINT
tara:strand:- start:332 stop:811 length:480 start_codon:yes stop_codon:yes gene_type:complete